MVLTCRVLEGKSGMAADKVFVVVMNNKADFFRADKTDIGEGRVTEKTGFLHYFSLFI